MTFFIEDTTLILSHVLYKTALIITVLRWIFTWILRYRSRPTTSPPPISPQTIKQSLAVTTFHDVLQRSPSSVNDTCAVCLGTLEENDEIRELRNCSHVYHRDCIDRWLDYECNGGGDEDNNNNNNHRNCPLCRTPLLPANTTSFADWSSDINNNHPSWAVERLLYLFGDDLIR